MKVYELKPINGRKSFYGKAEAVEYSNGDIELRSYNTIVARIRNGKCESCGALFYVTYCSDGTYEYMNDVCDCESEFHPYFSNEPTLSEFMSMFNKESYNRKNYTYKVCLCDGHYCDGHITVRADDEDEAYEMVMDYVLGGLAKALLELGIDVSIELED